VAGVEHMARKLAERHQVGSGFEIQLGGGEVLYRLRRVLADGFPGIEYRCNSDHRLPL